MDEEEIGRVVLNCAYKVHTLLGPGLLESAYEACMAHEVSKHLRVARQVELPIEYDGMRIEAGYRIDLLVAGRVVVELKVVQKISDIHVAQILSYLKLGGYRLGYLLNFNVRSMRDGVKRIVNNK